MRSCRALDSVTVLVCTSPPTFRRTISMPETVARAERMLLCRARIAGRQPKRARPIDDAPDALRAKLHEYRSAHDICDCASQRIPGHSQSGERQGQHPPQRGASSGNDDGPRDPARLPRSPSAERRPQVYGKACALRTTGRSSSTHTTTDSRSIRPSGPRRPWQPVLRDKAARRERTDPFRFRALRVDPGQVADVRPLASDDKSPALAMLVAIDALKAAGVPLSVNSSSSSRARRKRGRATFGNSWKRTQSSSRPTRGCSATARCTSRAGSRSCSECAVSRASSSRRTAHRTGCTAVTMEIGRRIQSRCSPTSSRACGTTTAGFSSRILRRRRADHAGRAPCHRRHPGDRLRDARRGAARRHRGEECRARRAHHAAALNLRGIRGGGVGATASNTIPTEATRRSTSVSCRGRRRNASGNLSKHTRGLRDTS